MKKVFTLIELVVMVLGILMMAALFLPALSVAQEKAKIASCEDNLKQLSSYTAMYGEDSDGYLIPNIRVPAGMKQDWGDIWPTVLARYMNGESTAPHYGMLYQQKKIEAFVCPVEPRGIGSYAQGKMACGCYAANILLVGDAHSTDRRRAPRRYSELTEPAVAMHLMDGAYTTNPSPDNIYFGYRHGGKEVSGTANPIKYVLPGGNMNVVFADGHVEGHNIDWFKNASGALRATRRMAGFKHGYSDGGQVY